MNLVKEKCAKGIKLTDYVGKKTNNWSRVFSMKLSQSSTAVLAAVLGGSV